MKCFNCHVENKDDAKFCMNCGAVLNDSLGQKKGKDPKEKSAISLILSIINIICVLPFVVTFGGMWLIFGAFSGNSITYYGILILCAGYGLFSLGFLIFSITRMIRNTVSDNSMASSIVKAIVIVAFTYVIVALVAALIYFF